MILYKNMKQSKPQYPLIYIEWCDAMTNESRSWLSLGEMMDWSDSLDWVIMQTGFLVKETPKYILIVAQLNPQTGGDVMFGCPTKIPKTWIRKRKTIKL